MPDKNLPQNTDQEPSREDKLIEYLSQGLPMWKAGVKAGYSEGYSRTALSSRKWKDDQFIAKLIKAHRFKAISLLPKSNRADKRKFQTADNALKDLSTAINQEKDPIKRAELHAKGMQILSKLEPAQERINKASGLLKEHRQDVQVTVPIREMQLILSQSVNLPERPTQKSIDAEYTDASDQGHNYPKE